MLVTASHAGVGGAQSTPPHAPPDEVLVVLVVDVALVATAFEVAALVVAVLEVAPLVVAAVVFEAPVEVAVVAASVVLATVALPKPDSDVFDDDGPTPEDTDVFAKPPPP